MKTILIAIMLFPLSALAVQRYRLDMEVKLGLGQMSKSTMELDEGETGTFESEDHFFEVVPSASGRDIKMDFVVGVSKDEGDRSDVTSKAGVIVKDGNSATFNSGSLEAPRENLTVKVLARKIRARK